MSTCSHFSSRRCRSSLRGETIRRSTSVRPSVCATDLPARKPGRQAGKTHLRLVFAVQPDIWIERDVLPESRTLSGTSQQGDTTGLPGPYLRHVLLTDANRPAFTASCRAAPRHSRPTGPDNRLLRGARWSHIEPVEWAGGWVAQFLHNMGIDHGRRAVSTGPCRSCARAHEYQPLVEVDVHAPELAAFRNPKTASRTPGRISRRRQPVLTVLSQMPLAAQVLNSAVRPHPAQHVKSAAGPS